MKSLNLITRIEDIFSQTAYILNRGGYRGDIDIVIKATKGEIIAFNQELRECAESEGMTIIMLNEPQNDSSVIETFEDKPQYYQCRHGRLTLKQQIYD